MSHGHFLESLGIASRMIADAQKRLAAGMTVRNMAGSCFEFSSDCRVLAHGVVLFSERACYSGLMAQEFLIPFLQFHTAIRNYESNHR